MDTGNTQQQTSSNNHSHSPSDDITLEELPEDYTPSINETETLHPTSYSSPSSSVNGDYPSSDSDDTMSDTGTGMTQRFQALQCDEKMRKPRRSQSRRKRNVPVFKRTFSESVEGEKDVQTTPMDNFRRKAVPRRMRRRVERPMNEEWVEEVMDGGNYNDVRSPDGRVDVTADRAEEYTHQVAESDAEGGAMEMD
ncbi:hypothetical protein MBLNU457_7418t2 [Dothideomycetes sp. NU457]